MKAIDRIYNYLNAKGIKQTVFERQVGLGNGYLGKARDRKGGIGEEALRKIVEKCPELTVEYLVTGNRRSSNNKVAEPQAHYNLHNQGVPYFDVDFVGGFDLIFNSNQVRPNFYINYPPFNHADYYVNVTGQSMSPILESGDLIAISRVPNWRDFLLFGEIYALVTDNFRTVKKVGAGSKQDDLLLIPTNQAEAFENQEIPKKLIQHVFKVHGSIKKFF